MHSWKKKLVVSQLALACTLAITSQANAATNDISGQTYNTFHHYNDATYADDVYYDGYVGWNNYAADSYYNGDIYPVINNATVDSIGQRNSYVKTWGCGGFLNETNIYSRGKSLCF